MMKRTERHQSLQYDISASAEVLIRDQPGIVSQCTQFFSDHGWDIQAMQTITLEQQPFNLLKANFQLNLSKQGRRARLEDGLRRFLSWTGRRVVRIHRQSQVRLTAFIRGDPMSPLEAGTQAPISPSPIRTAIRFASPTCAARRC